MDVLELTQQLVRFPSVTPDDAGIHDLLTTVLADAGFVATHLDAEGVRNVWLAHGTGHPVVACVCHCDVVPPGPADAWLREPFSGETDGEFIHGRGSADMKGGLAAAVLALLQIAHDWPDHPGTLALLCTSDEEGVGRYGVRHALTGLPVARIDAALVTEPTSEVRFGDAYKVGRRGSVSFTAAISGVQGHVAYPQFARNAAHAAAQLVTALTAETWDSGDDLFPATGLQITRLVADSGAGNVIPGSAELRGNFRYAPCLTAAEIEARCRALADSVGAEAAWTFTHGAEPFVTHTPAIRAWIADAIFAETGIVPTATVSGGTSDARFLAAHHVPVVEFGALNATIHAANERTEVANLPPLQAIYARFLRRALTELACADLANAARDGS
ncbi:MAG: succinyl-diaminopimelate desuccinylase [Fimbriimonadaceae bacterium]|nr:succinyl-diaminopimelate desuccinylase [Fimbriimonadaceae bacterium]